MEETHNETNVPFIVFEAVEAKADRTQKRLIIAVVVAILLLFCTNAIWLWAWTQYDYVSDEDTIEVVSDGRGISNFNSGTQGDLTNESSYSDETNESENEKKW